MLRSLICVSVVLVLNVQNALLDEVTTQASEAGVTENIVDMIKSINSTLLRILPDESVAENAIQHNLDTWEAPYEIRKNYPYYLAGYSEDDLPIWGMELGHWDLRKIVSKGGEDLKTFDKYLDQMAYRMLESLKAVSTPENPVKDALFLADFDGLRLEQLAHVPSVRWLINLSIKYRDLIAEHLGGTVIVNANFVAENLVNILRPVFGNLLEKVEVYGTNRAKWLPVTRRKFGDKVPQYYGGAADFKPLKVYG